MKRILGLVASPRILGNSEILAKAAMEATGADNQMEMIRLADLEIKPCTACYACLAPEVSCHLKDDLNYLLDKIKAADAVVLAAPCYFLGPNGIIKLIQDRFLSVANNSREFAGKPCITITTYGVPEREGYTEAALNLTAMFLNLQLIDSASFLGANPTEVLDDPANLARVRQMGRGLVEPNYIRKPKVNECPVCWSNLLQFNGKEVTCPFCGTKGEIKVVEQEASLVFNPQPNHLLSEEARRHHFEVFLNEKKQEFMAKRQQYKEIQGPYRSMDWWVSPPK